VENDARCACEGEGGCPGCPDAVGHACDEILSPVSESRSDIVVLLKAGVIRARRITLQSDRTSVHPALV